MKHEVAARRRYSTDADKERPEMGAHLVFVVWSLARTEFTDRPIPPITPSSSFYRNALRAPFLFSTYRPTRSESTNLEPHDPLVFSLVFDLQFRVLIFFPAQVLQAIR